MATFRARPRPTTEALPLLQQTLLGAALDSFGTAEELFGINSSALMPRPTQAAIRVADVVAGTLRAATSSIQRKEWEVLDVDSMSAPRRPAG